MLAAGESLRMGTPKQLLKFNGETLLNRSVRAAVDSKCDSIVVVFGEKLPMFERELNGLHVEVVYNSNWNAGMGSSIRAGLEKLLTNDAVVIMVCDQPYVDAKCIDDLVEKYIETKAPIVAAKYANTLGVPALFDKIHFAELRNLSGKSGAKTIIETYISHTETVDFPKGAIDIDSPGDYANLC